jgi:hypothetical protein
MNSTHLHKLMKKTNAAPSFSPRLHGRPEKAEHTATLTTVHAPATTAGQGDSIFSSTDLRRAPRPFTDGGAAEDHGRNWLRPPEQHAGHETQQQGADLGQEIDDHSEQTANLEERSRGGPVNCRRLSRREQRERRAVEGEESGLHPRRLELCFHIFLIKSCPQRTNKPIHKVFFTREHRNFRLPQNLKNLANLPAEIIQTNFEFESF